MNFYKLANLCRVEADVTLHQVPGVATQTNRHDPASSTTAPAAPRRCPLLRLRLSHYESRHKAGRCVLEAGEELIWRVDELEAAVAQLIGEKEVPGDTAKTGEELEAAASQLLEEEDEKRRGCGRSSTPSGPLRRRRPARPCSWFSTCSGRRPQRRWRLVSLCRGPRRSLSDLDAYYHSRLQSHGIDQDLGLSPMRMRNHRRNRRRRWAPKSCNRSTWPHWSGVEQPRIKQWHMEVKSIVVEQRAIVKKAVVHMSSFSVLRICKVYIC